MYKEHAPSERNCRKWFQHFRNHDFDVKDKECKGFNYAFVPCRYGLWILGVWPDPFAPLNDFNRPSIRFIIVMCAVFLYVVMPQMTNMILAWGNVTRVVQDFGSVNFSLLSLFKLFGTWYHGKTLRTLTTSVMTDWMTSKNSEERNTMLHLTKYARTLSIRCYVMMIIFVLSYLYFQCLKIYRNISQPQRSLVYPFNYPYNIQKSPNYEITCLMQLFAASCTAVINTSVDTFISTLLLHICAQLINLRTALNNLVDELAKGSISSLKFKKGLAEITMRHEDLIRDTKIVNNCYSAVLFIHVFATTFQLCFKSFQLFTIITSHLGIPIFNILYLLFYFAFVFMHLYVYCYSAERLLTESTNMMYGVYECRWYDLPPKNAKSLMFMIYRSSIPLRLKAGKFGIFSLEMFGATVKTSMGYLSVLLTLMD